MMYLLYAVCVYLGACYLFGLLLLLRLAYRFKLRVLWLRLVSTVVAKGQPRTKPVEAMPQHNGLAVIR